MRRYLALLLNTGPLTDNHDSKMVSRFSRIGNNEPQASNVPELIWLILCMLSLVTYLVASESLRAFGREVVRLVAKL